MKKLRNILILLCFLGGAGLMLYPTIGEIISSREQALVVNDYEDQAGKMDPQQKEKELKLAEIYNQSLTGGAVRDPFIPGSGMAIPDNYMEILDFNGVMAAIEIPGINIELPIYHGTSDTVLEKGVGHLEQTAFPIGGLGNHTVLSAHRGLPQAKLFTDLDKVKEGDFFYIHILDETLTYQVDQIKIVEPADTSDLVPQKEKDLITLITCTPYGINSHRLLVRGERAEDNGDDMRRIQGEEQMAAGRFPWKSLLFIAMILIILFVILRIHYRKKLKGGSD